MIGFSRRYLRLGGLLILVIEIAAAAPTASAEDTYPPGWNKQSTVPPSQYRFIPSWGDSKPYWLDQKWPGDNPSRYGPDLCHWDWCKGQGNGSTLNAKRPNS
jgi:hypothetical protein